VPPRECYGREVRNGYGALSVAVSFAIVAFVVPLCAGAQPGERADRDLARDGVDVTWTAPDECPSGLELRRRVAARVPADAAVRARGRVDKRAGRYRLTLEIATASSRGERALDASTCEALASSAAVVIAISVAPASAREAEASAAEAPEAASAPPASSAETAPVAATAASSAAAPERTTPIDAPRANESSRFLVRAQLAGDAGLLPSAAVGGGLAFGAIVVRDVSVEASANLFVSQDGTIAGTPARGASFGLLSAAVRACWALTHGIEVAPCLGIEIARISASGFGAAQVSDATAVTWGPEALLAGRIPIAGPLSLRVGVGAFAPMSRQSFVINAGGTVHRPGPIALRTFAGPEVRF
jgi:hypothetical protein